MRSRVPICGRPIFGGRASPAWRAKAARRLLAIAFLLEGWSRTFFRSWLPAVRDNISLLPLPIYGRELSLVENLWQILRSNFPSHRIWNTYDDVLSACSDAWKKLMQAPKSIASLTKREWIKTVTGCAGWHQQQDMPKIPPNLVAGSLHAACYPA